MSFEKVITEPCIVKLGAIDPTTGEPVCPVEPPTPPTDPNCDDPAYRLAHPELCDGVQVLIIKPGSLTLCTPLGTQFKTFVYANGVEMEVSAGVEYRSSDGNVIQIGVLSGKASAVGGGIATISASWQGLSAFAQITVVDGDVCCEDTKVGMLVLFDNSKSMKRAFGFPYGNRIFYAKALVNHFFSSINENKDVGALMRFNDSGQLEAAFSNDLVHLQQKVAAMPSSDFGTDIAEGLKDAIEYINTDTTLTHKVIVLVTDGDDNIGGIDPRVVADGFINDGGILVVVGIRAYGDGFDTLALMASGGFFLNALPSNASEMFQFLSGLKGYFCAGNCVPVGDIVIARAELDYDNFEKWTVTGVVDLIGGTPPYELFDFLPGHGLYVDMIGSSIPYYGKLTSRNQIELEAGLFYRIKFKVAGNQREEYASQSIQVKVGTALNETIAIIDWKQDFTEYEFDFSSVAGEFAYISFEQTTGSIAPGLVYGLLLDDISVIKEPENENEIVFEDDFDEENAIYIEPKCGMGTIVVEGDVGYGENCYGEGCLEAPPGAQSPDPTPLLDDLEP